MTLLPLSLKFETARYIVALALLSIVVVDGFNVVYMAKRGGKGGLKRTLEDSPRVIKKKKDSGTDTPNRRVQEITGVTLPAEGEVRGWELGDGVRLACANVQGTYYAVQVSQCVFEQNHQNPNQPSNQIISFQLAP